MPGMNRFAAVVFYVAGTWGGAVLLPLFLHDVAGRAYPVRIQRNASAARIAACRA